MKNLNIFKTFDVFFRLTVIILFNLVWCRYFIRNLPLSILATVIATTIIEIAVHFISKKQNKNKSQKQEFISDLEQYTNTFLFWSSTQVVTFFYNLAKTKYSVTKRTHFIQIEHPSSRIILYPYFMFKDLTCDDVIFVFNKVKNLCPIRIIICTNKVDSGAINIAEKLPIEIVILDQKQTYKNLLKKYDFYPPKTQLNKPQTKTLKQLLAYALNKKRTKGYFFTSVLMLFCSFIVPYKLYYVVMSSILLVLSFASFKNPQFNQTINVSVLDV